MKRTIQIPQFANSKVTDELTIEVKPSHISISIRQGQHGALVTVTADHEKSYEITDALEAAQAYFPNRK